MRLYRCEKIFRLITEWIFKILIDSTNEQLKYEKKINSNHIFINPNFNIEDFEVEKIDLDDFNI